MCNAYAVCARNNTQSPATAVGCFVVFLSPCLCVQVCNQGLSYVTQADEVMRVGGKAMVVLNDQYFDRLVPPISTAIPYVQLLAKYRDTVLQYARTTGASATVGALTVKRGMTAPAMAWFSSRGPARAGGGWVMKPDITAPGALPQLAGAENIMTPSEILS